MKTHKIYNLVLVLAFVFSLGGMPSTSVFAEESSPYIQAFPDQDRVNANNWPMDTVITMTVNGSYTYISKVGQSSWDPNGTTAGFDIRSYGLKAGDTISMTGGGITRSMTVTALQINSIDANTSTVSGTADADKQVYVWVNGAGGMWLTPNPDGTWTADFAPFSFVPGTEGGATQPDAAGNTTQTGWHTLTPVIQAFPDQDKVNANDWPIGTVVSMTINDSNTYTARVGASSWDPYGTTAEIWVENHDVQAGDAISMTGAGITRSMTITSLEITNIDVNNATVSGIADADKIFQVWVNGGSHFYITPEENGEWTANFAPFVFVPGTNGGAQQTDELGNYTQIDWSLAGLPRPRMEIDIYGNHIFASDWIVGSDVTVSFDIPGSDEEWDYSKTVTVPDGWGAWCQFQIDIDPTEFHIAVGQVVRISDGTTTRQATIPEFSVTSEDPTADTISGIAPAGSTVNLQAFYFDMPGRAQRYPVANIDGHWFADFSQPGIGSDEQDVMDLLPGKGTFWVTQSINDFVGIRFFWDFGPFFYVFPEEGRVETYVWPWGVNLTLTIDDPATEENPDLTRTQENSSHQTNFDNLGTILPGFTVSITDGLVTKTHTVTDLTVTGADSQTETVTGTAEPDSMVDLLACGDNGCVNRHVSAGGDRIWLANFSVPGEGDNAQGLFDVRPGDTNEVQQADIDGDTTKLYWRAPNPPSFSVLPDEDSIEGNDWPLDSTLTIRIDDPVTPDYSISTSVNPPDQDHNQTWFKLDLANIFDLQPGQIVTVSDTKTTKQTTIVPRNITLIDPATDTVTGEAEPNIVNVVLWIPCGSNDSPVRVKNVNADGSWFVNFGFPGEQPWEDDIVDIQPETMGGIYQGDVDGDGTTYLEWTVMVLPWTLKGFYQPVDMNGVYNIVKGGSTVPLKFEIFVGNTELTDVATTIKGLTYTQTSCDANVITDEIETTGTGGTSLRYDVASGQFIYNWKTPETAGKCYRVTMTTFDGSSLVAYFKLK